VLAITSATYLGLNKAACLSVPPLGNSATTQILQGRAEETSVMVDLDSDDEDAD